jgi:hypothetical protein
MLTKDELQLAVLERKVLRRIFGPSETKINGRAGTIRKYASYMENQKL